MAPMKKRKYTVAGFNYDHDPTKKEDALFYGDLNKYKGTYAIDPDSELGKSLVPLIDIVRSKLNEPVIRVDMTRQEIHVFDKSTPNESFVEIALEAWNDEDAQQCILDRIFRS